MTKTTNLNVRLDPEIKSHAELLFSRFGITLTDAVNMFLHQALLLQKLPFALPQPRFDRYAEEAIREAEEIAAGLRQTKSYASAEELFQDFETKC